MTLFYAVFIYFLIWWVMLFTMLPMGVEKYGDNDQGLEPGAPKKPDLKKKLIMNTIVSALILLAIEILIRAGVITWWDWFEPK